jgi:multicomponent Na+:H+ antiporter subunit E
MRPDGEPIRHPPERPALRNVLIRFLFFGAVWIVVSGGDTKGWGLALAIVVGVSWISLRMSPPVESGVALVPLLRFGPFFLLHSLKGGLDVALRALRPDSALSPEVVWFDLRLSAVLGLFPGTLSTRLDGDRIEIHVLDRSMPIEAQFRELERRVEALFSPARG